MVFRDTTEKRNMEKTLQWQDRHDALTGLINRREFERRLEKTGQPCEVQLYPGAGHAFMNETRPEMYRPEAAADAWPRMVAFFRTHLG